MATTKKKKTLTKKQQKKIKKTVKKYPFIVGIILGLVIVLAILYFTKILDPVIEKVNPEYTWSALSSSKKKEDDPNKKPEDVIVENGDLQIYAIEMHDQYGDALFVKYGDVDMLIDSGNYGDGKYVQSFVDEHISDDKNLDVLIATHCHGDHLGGITTSVKSERALNNVSTISNIIDFGHDREYSMQTTYEAIRESYINKGANYYPAYESAHNLNGLSNILEFGELKIEIIDTGYYARKTTTLPSGTDFNAYSVAVLITYKNVKMFCAGDLENAGELALVKNYKATALNDITEDNNVIYKMCHHGTDVGDANSDREGTQEDGGNRFALLEIIKPDYVIVSSCITAVKDTAAHPYPRAIATCLYFTENLYFNGTNGTLCLNTDGDKIQVTGEGCTTKYLINNQKAPDYEAEKNLRYIDTEYYKTSTIVGNRKWYKGDASALTIQVYVEWYLNELKNKFN